MSDRALINLLRGLAAFLIAMPGTLQLVPNLEMSPAANALLLVAALAGATIMSQLPPAGKDPEMPAGSTVDDLLPALEALSVEDRAELSARLEWRALSRERRQP